MGEVCATYERDEKYVQSLLGKSEEKIYRHREETSINIMKSMVFWVVTPCISERARQADMFLNLTLKPEDGVDMLLRNAITTQKTVLLIVPP